VRAALRLGSDNGSRWADLRPATSESREFGGAETKQPNRILRSGCVLRGEHGTGAVGEVGEPVRSASQDNAGTTALFTWCVKEIAGCVACKVRVFLTCRS